MAWTALRELPTEEDGFVVITYFDSENAITFTDVARIENGNWMNGYGEELIPQFVLAWQPLPKPYKRKR